MARMMTNYEQQFPEEARELNRVLSGRLPENWQSAIPSFRTDDRPAATRSVSGKVIEALAPVVPELMGGSAILRLPPRPT